MEVNFSLTEGTERSRLLSSYNVRAKLMSSLTFPISCALSERKRALLVQEEVLWCITSTWRFWWVCLGQPGASSCKLLCPRCQSLVEETDCHHQAHKKGPGAKSPTTRGALDDRSWPVSLHGPCPRCRKSHNGYFCQAWKKTKLSSFSHSFKITSR